MEKKKIERINFLAHKSKTEGLSDSEKAEQQQLRDEYRAYMRNGYMAQLNRVYIAEPDGSEKKLLKETKDKKK